MLQIFFRAIFFIKIMHISKRENVIVREKKNP